jgi:hypothetical protein
MLVVALLTSTGLGVPLPRNQTAKIGLGRMPRNQSLGRRPEFAATPNADVQTTPYGPPPEGFAEESSGIMNGSYSSLVLKGNVRAYWTMDDTQHGLRVQCGTLPRRNGQHWLVRRQRLLRHTGRRR